MSDNHDPPAGPPAGFWNGFWKTWDRLIEAAAKHMHPRSMPFIPICFVCISGFIVSSTFKAFMPEDLIVALFQWASFIGFFLGIVIMFVLNASKQPPGQG